MSASPPPKPAGSSPEPSADDASIHLLAELILDGLVDGDMPPSIVRFSRTGSAIQLAACPLDDAHPSGLLVGYRPDDCFALGVAAHGWAYPIEQRSRPDRSRTRVHLVSVVSCSGEHAHLTYAEDPDHPLNDVGDAVPSGEQVDLLRRSFALSTDPPPCGTDTYWSMEWLAAVADTGASLGSGGRMEWADVSQLHPAATLLDAGGLEASVHDFTEMVTSFGRVCDWGRVRYLVDRGTYDHVDLVPGDGEWFDDGSIARYLLARMSPLPELRSMVQMVVSPDADRRIDEVLDALCVPSRVWPDVDASAA